MNRHALLVLLSFTLCAAPAAAARPLSAHQAAAAGDLKALEKALEKTPVDAWDHEGRTPLMLAAAEGRLEAVKRLLEMGASLTAQDEGLRQPLHHAAAGPSLPVLELLLERGADPLAYSYYGTPLYAALRARREAQARRLLDAPGQPEADEYGRTPLSEAVRLPELFQELASRPGADLSQRTRDGMTLLMNAAAAGSTDTVRWLLAKGADKLARDENGEQAAYHATGSGSFAVFSLLAEGSDVAGPCHGPYCTPALGKAGRAGSVETLRWLLNKGADAAGPESAYYPALHSVAQGGSVAALKALLDAGVPVDLLDRYDATPLMKAARYSTPEMVKALLDAGAKAAAEDSDGRTPLSHAAESGSPEKVKLLLDAGADRALASYDDVTPAMYAARSGSVKALELLLDRKTLDLPDSNGRTALHHAAAAGQAETAEYLLGKGASLDAGRGELLKHAIEKGAWEPVQLLLAARRRDERDARLDLVEAAKSCSPELLKQALAAPGADASSREGGSSGAPLLVLAAGRGRCFDAVKLLLSRGADVHAPDGEGRTPVMAAAGASAPSLKLLLSRGGDPSAPMREGYYKGRTPLHAAAGSAERVKLLLDKGAKIAADPNGVTPVMLAAEASDPRSFRLLESESEPGAADKNGKTLLMYAAGGAVESLEALLARGADPRATDKNGVTALHVAAGSWYSNHRKVLALLGKGAPPDPVDNDGVSPLLRSLERKDARVPRLLAAKGALPGRVAKNGSNALHFAAYADDAEMLRAALELAPDADPNAKGIYNYRPLDRATSSIPPAVRLLLERGAMVNSPDGKKNFLAEIATYRPFSLVKLVLDRGGDVNAKCPLCNAAAGGRRATARALLERGAGVNAKGDYDRTPLYRAADYGRASMVRLLLEKGAQLAGTRALTAAADDGHVAAMAALLEKGADPDEPTLEGVTPLRLAAKSGRAAAVRLLLDEGAKVESAPEKSPLFDAARSGSLPVLKLLERKGGGLKLALPSGYTLLHAAAESGSLEMLRHLLDAGLAPGASDSEKGTPLWLAVDNGKFAAADLLLARGASVEGNVKGDPFLHRAMGWNCGTRGKWLLDHGAKPDALDFEGRSALFKSDSIECMTLLLGRGANVNLQAKDGSTALIRAAEGWSSGPRVKLLLERNAYHFYRRQDGRSALSLAASNGNTEALEALVAAGAGIDDSDGKNVTPLMYAVESGSTRAVRVLLEKGADPNRVDSDQRGAFWRATAGWRKSPDIARTLAKAGAKVDVRDSNGTTPLMAACNDYNISTETVKMLLELGADPNVVDKWNNMPLAYALDRENFLAAGMLADKGADLDASTRYGTPVLVSAARDGKLAAVRFLAERGAKLDVSAADSGGRTALMEASYNGHLDIVRYLVEKGASLTQLDKSGNNALKWAEIGNKSAVQTYLAPRTPSAAPAAAAAASAPAAAPAAPVAHAPAQPGVSSADLQNLVKAAVQGAMEASKPAAPAKKSYSSDVDRPSYKNPERAEDVALVIGVERYAGDLPPADHAERDAAAVKAHLSALGVPPRNLIHLTGERAGRASIQKYVEQWLPNVVKPGSRVYVYFSGHGAPDVKKGESYLVPWDGDPNYLETTAYPVARLYDRLDKLPAKEVLVAMDACFSGAKGRSVLPKGARPLVTKVSQAKPAGRVLSLSASDSNEISGTLDEQGHGLFTYYLLKGLNSGGTTVSGLYGYLKPKVQDEAGRSNRQQTPQFAGNGDFTLR